MHGGRLQITVAQQSCATPLRAQGSTGLYQYQKTMRFALHETSKDTQLVHQLDTWEASRMCSRRCALAVGAVGLALSMGGVTPALAAEETSLGSEYVTYTSDVQGYSLARPASWEQVGKAGADALFRDPQQKSTTVGVTVYPVMIASLEEFGSLEEVGKKLLDAERAKESTLGVELMSQQQRPNSGSGGGTMYDFKYRLESTRGSKQIFSTVMVVGKKLYILNGSLKCQKAGKGEEPAVCDAEAAAVLQRVAASFKV